MKLKIYQIDAFTNEVFCGNPAAVCPLETWLPEEIMQKIAMENNLAETAFYVKKENDYEIRWFTPTVEVDLCGHATLAAAYVLFYYEGHPFPDISFVSPRTGLLKVNKQEEFLTLNFPADSLERISMSPQLLSCFNILPTEAFKGKTDYMLVYANEEHIQNLVPDYSAISQLKARGIIVTAKGNKSDFVSRFFAPQSGVNEDPVTGSAHTTLIPYWAEKTGRKEFSAVQLSQRGGYLKCKYLGSRVEISGQAKIYLTGQIFAS